MVISEFAIHNALRTYSRQDRLAKFHKTESQTERHVDVEDRVALSATGKKAQFVGLLAAELAERRNDETSSEQTGNAARALTEELMTRHKEEINDASISPDRLETLLRPIYFPGD